MKKSLFISLLFIAFLWVSKTAQATPPATKPALQTGIWKGVLYRADGKKIVFNFTTAKLHNKQVLYVQNAGEKLLVDSIFFKADSVFIQMPFFNSGFALRLKPDGNLEGNYIKNYGAHLQIIPFTAMYGNPMRYPAISKPLYNITGKWAVNFEGKTDVETKAVGEFKQERDGTVTGTFLTPTGDYRYLEGVINADSMMLSAFDGGHAILFTAKLDNDSTVSQAFLYNGLTAKQKWTAVKNDTATLPNGYQITKLREGETQLNFRFKSTNGDTVSINDKAYKNKVVIVQILGSWCPNCMDETAFLSEYYKKNKQRGVEIIGLAYERSEDYRESKKALLPFQKRFNVAYPFLVTGVAVTDEKRTEKTLPQIDNLQAFPTTIFIDKKGNVAKIHTGYSGPATGEHYEEFKKEFEEEIDGLLKEQ